MQSAEPPPPNLRAWICDKINRLSNDDRKEVLHIATKKIPQDRFINSADGCRVSLDKSISDEVIYDLYIEISKRLIVFEGKEYD